MDTCHRYARGPSGQRMRPCPFQHTVTFITSILSMMHMPILRAWHTTHRFLCEPAVAHASPENRSRGSNLTLLLYEGALDSDRLSLQDCSSSCATRRRHGRQPRRAAPRSASPLFTLVTRSKLTRCDPRRCIASQPCARVDLTRVTSMDFEELWTSLQKLEATLHEPNTSHHLRRQPARWSLRRAFLLRAARSVAATNFETRS
jgi:hypothetical protein